MSEQCNIIPEKKSEKDLLVKMYEQLESTEVRIAIEGEIKKLTENIPKLQGKSLKEIHESLWGKYSGTAQQIANIFSYAFIQSRDNIEVNEAYLTINLTNTTSTLRVRKKNKYSDDENNLDTVIYGINHGTEVKSLGEEVEFNGLNYIKVNFIGKNGEEKEGFIAKKYTQKQQNQTEDQNKSFQNLNGYMRSIGINPNTELKEEIARRIGIFGEKVSNTQLYHKLIQDYELRIRIEKIVHEINCKTSIKRVKNENTTLNGETNETQENINNQEEIIKKKGEVLRESKKEKKRLQNNIKPNNENIIDTLHPEVNYSLNNYLKKFEIVFGNNKQNEQINPPLLTKEMKEKKIAEEKQAAEEHMKIIHEREEKKQRFENGTDKERKDIATEDIINTLKENLNIVRYLQNKYPEISNIDEQITEFQKSHFGILKNEINTFEGYIKIYIWLFINTYKEGSPITVGEYYRKISGKNWPKNNKNSIHDEYDNLLNDSTPIGGLLYKGSDANLSNGLKIFRGLIINNDTPTTVKSYLKSKIEIERNRPLFDYETYGLAPDKMNLVEPAFNSAEEPLCGLTVRKNYFFKEHKIVVDAYPVIKTYIENEIKSGAKIYNRTSLEEEIRSIFRKTGNNTFDIFPNTNNGHRAVIEIGKDGELYVLDPHNYKSYGPVKINHYLVNEYPDMVFLLGTGHTIES